MEAREKEREWNQQFNYPFFHFYRLIGFPSKNPTVEQTSLQIREKGILFQSKFFLHFRVAKKSHSSRRSSCKIHSVRVFAGQATQADGKRKEEES